MMNNFSNFNLTSFSSNPFALTPVCSSLYATAINPLVSPALTPFNYAANNLCAFSPLASCATVSAAAGKIYATSENDDDDYNSIYSDIKMMDQSVDEEDDDNEYDLDCTSSHPYVKALRIHQDKVFRNDNNNNNNSTTAVSTTTVSTPFNDIISFINEQTNYYEHLNEEMKNQNNYYYNIFLKNISKSLEYQKKINQLELLLTDLKITSEKLKSVKNQTNYLNKLQ